VVLHCWNFFAPGKKSHKKLKRKLITLSIFYL
jgi:hypothetical protein